jgi:hypothetical protein
MQSHLWRQLGLSAALAVAAAGQPGHAAVIRFEMLSQQPLASGAGSFGSSGPAQKLIARATIALDPTDPRNAVIADLDRAPRDPEGKVEAVTDVMVLRPAVPNGVLLVELPNRGGSVIYGILDDLDPRTAGRLDQVGNAFLLSQGYTLVVIGWQGDIAPGQGIGIRVPVAKGLTGYSREQWILSDADPVKRETLSWPVSDPATASIGIRHRAYDEKVTPPGLSFRLLDPQTLQITRPAGEAGRGTYELSYLARDPGIMGMGFAALRDVSSFLLHAPGPDNPLTAGKRPLAKHALATGVSQTGRALRDLLYLGFNEDESGRRVFDGMLPVIPGTRRTFTNARFAQPGRNPGTEADALYPIDQFPFTYEVSTDARTGRTDGLLLRCRRSHTCPRILEFDSEYEMWGARGSLLMTDTAGKPLGLPAEVRAYMLVGSPHMNAWNAVSKPNPGCALPSSPVFAGPALRALLTDLDQWVTRDVAPPPSRFPSAADGTLVPAVDVYPKGVPVPYHGQYLHAPLVEQTSAGPVVKGEYPVLLPKAGPDGNAVAGLKLPLVVAPRATYTGWNPQVGVSGPQDLCDHAGGMLPLAHTRAERLAAGDTRPSLEELYPTPAAYTTAVKSGADKLVADRLLLQEDAQAAIKNAQ